MTGRNEPSLQRVAAAVQESGGSSAFGLGDVSNESDVRRLFGEASAFFGVHPQEACDLLVTSAGIGRSVITSCNLLTRFFGVVVTLARAEEDMQVRQD